MSILKATKRPGFFIEPLKTRHHAGWEGHHATNPCVIRFSTDPRVFLGYRAGGDADFFHVAQHRVWGSHLGLAVLDEAGEKIACRLPLPIMTLEHGIPLPQSPEEYEQFIKTDKVSKAYVLHDFRFTEYRGYLYVVFHEGPVNECYDCVVRMPVSDFVAKVNRSIEISDLPEPQRTGEWRKLWWRDTTWEPAGIRGTNRIFGSRINKGDIIYFELADGTLQMCHRPLASGCAVLPVGEKFYADMTEDGLTAYGVFESNTRPGYTDNSHIGNNGGPTRARVGKKKVYIDVTHGCWSHMIAMGQRVPMDIMYYASLRVKDAATGELLYYSEDPIIDYGKDWNRCATAGTWIAENPALQGVMFVGGQVERIAGKNGLDHEFITYVGLGDTSVGLASFRLRDALPGRVAADIQTRDADLKRSVKDVPEGQGELKGAACGWRWSVRNNSARRTVEIVRTLPAKGEVGVREFNSRPGYFDAHGLAIHPEAIMFDKELEAWVIAYQGIRLTGTPASPQTQSACGFLVVNSHNPEQLYYRSMLPVTHETLDGWRFATSGAEARILRHYRELIPERVLAEIRNLAILRQDGLPWSQQFETWLKQKSGLEKAPAWPMPAAKRKPRQPAARVGK